MLKKSHWQQLNTLLYITDDVVALYYLTDCLSACLSALQMVDYPLNDKLFNWNSHPLKVLSR